MKKVSGLFATRNDNKTSMAFARNIFLTIVIFLIAANSFAAGNKISKKETQAYLSLASHVPKNVAFSVLASGVDNTINSIDAILKKYQKTDSTFKYDQFVISLKGGLGYNPFSTKELASMGLDLSFGVAAFGFSKNDAPFLILKANNAMKLETTLGSFALQLGQAKPWKEAKAGKAKVRYFTLDGTENTPVELAYAIHKDIVVLQAKIKTTKDFEKQVKTIFALKKNKSLQKDRNFTKLLSRLSSGTSVILYNDYKKYIEELKAGKAILEKELANNKEVPVDLPIIDLVNKAMILTESFNAQIFGMNLSAEKFSFVYELIGNKKGVRTFHGFFKNKNKKLFKNLDISKNAMGALSGNLNLVAIRDYFIKKNPKLKANYAKWKAEVQRIGKLDIDKDVIGNMTGEIGVLFYGMAKLPPELINGNGMTEQQIASLAKFVIVAGVKDPKIAAKVIADSEKKIRAEGKVVKELKYSGSRFISFDSEGVLLQVGMHKNLFLMGIGQNALETAFNGAKGLSLTNEKNIVAKMFFDFKNFANTMENLNPPANSPNTQLHQQYKIWKDQAEAKVRFFNLIKSKAILIPDGFRSTGEISF